MSGTETLEAVEAMEADEDGRAATGITSRWSEVGDWRASRRQTERWWSERRRTASPSASVYLSLNGLGKWGATKACNVAIEGGSGIRSLCRSPLGSRNLKVGGVKVEREKRTCILESVVGMGAGVGLDAFWKVRAAVISNCGGEGGGEAQKQEGRAY